MNLREFRETTMCASGRRNWIYIRAETRKNTYSIFIALLRIIRIAAWMVTRARWLSLYVHILYYTSAGLLALQCTPRANERPRRAITQSLGEYNRLKITFLSFCPFFCHRTIGAPVRFISHSPFLYIYIYTYIFT